MSDSKQTPDLDPADFAPALDRLRKRIGASFLGQEQVVEELVLGLFSGGHVLLQGVPGLGKTTLVKSLAEALALDFRRIQFTPDMMPGDVLGTRILEEPEGGRGRREFRFQRGPIFAHVVLADEINRATPRTQSALLEAMQERQVTVAGERMPLEEPFVVVATQNPIEMEGTYPLPEAQLDRFALRIDVPYPSREELEAVLASPRGPEPSAADAAAMSRADVLRLRSMVDLVPASSDVIARIAGLILATHPGPAAPEAIRRYVRHGASPRGGQAILAAARARALVRGRLHVSEDDVAAVAAPALRHRLILGYEGDAAGVVPDELVSAALEASKG